MTNTSRVTATHDANCTRVAASSSPHAAGGAPGGVPPAVALGSTSEAEVARTARTGCPVDGSTPDGYTLRRGCLSHRAGNASVSDATSPGEVAVPATAAPLHPRGQGISPGGSTSTHWPLLDDVTVRDP